MLQDITPYIVHEEIIEDHSRNLGRSGEGCIVKLNSGKLLFLYDQYENTTEDDDPVNFIKRISDDGGKSWSEKTVFKKTPSENLNIMSISLLHLENGEIACSYLNKANKNDCRPVFMKSSDDANTWSEPIHTLSRVGWYIVNNDRMVQLSTGRILIPYAWSNPDIKHAWNVFCGCAVSDDNGKTWRMSKGEIQIEAKNVIMPKLIDESREEALVDVRAGRAACQEPGIIELEENGRVMMWCRSPGGYAYRAFSSDYGDTWGEFKAIKEFAMPNGPQSIKRLPGSDRLIMIFNDREGVPYGHPQFQWRRPLMVAVSDDNAESWKRLGLLEPDYIPSNCYHSICFDGENVVFSYYEGVMQTSPDGIFSPRNLASLKVKIVKKNFFEL